MLTNHAHDGGADGGDHVHRKAKCRPTGNVVPTFFSKTKANKNS